MKNLRSKLRGRGPGLGMIWRIIWGVIRLITIRILAPIAGRDV